MKKISFLGVLLCTVAANAPALFIAKGTSELGLSGTFDFETESGMRMQGSLFYGYFIRDALQIGGMVDFQKDDDFTAWSLGPRVEYNADIGVEMVPFAAASLRIATVDGPSEYGDKTALVLGGEAGLKFFLNEYFAISGALKLDLATDDLYPNDDDFDQHDVRFELGVRTFF